MKTRHKIIVGGLGALTPVIMNLLVVDYSLLFADFSCPVFTGYIIRVIALFYLGGIVAFLHKNENSAIKIFELGIIAPALITTIINASNVQIPKNPVTDFENPEISLQLIPSAYAELDPNKEIKTFSLPKETWTQQVWRGFSGSTHEKVWFVIVGSHRNLEDAKNQVQQIDQEGKKFTAEVYKSYEGNPCYSVVIGANLTYDEAQQMRKQAVASGLPKDTYLWTLPK
jgi:hypothetical protein